MAVTAKRPKRLRASTGQDGNTDGRRSTATNFQTTRLPPLPLRDRGRGIGGLDELRQLADDLAQLGLLDDLRRLVRGKPAPLALAALGPYLGLLAHLQREDLDLAGDGGLRLQPLVVDEASDRPLADLSAHASLLEGLALCRHVPLAVLHRPALRDDPALGLARGDEHHLDAAVVDHLVGQRTDLAAALGGGLNVLVHRADLALPVAPRRFPSRAREFPNQSLPCFVCVGAS